MEGGPDHGHQRISGCHNLEPAVEPPVRASETVFRILLTISFCHLLNDTVQTTIMAYYPVLKSSFHLSFARVGLITLTYQ